VFVRINGEIHYLWRAAVHASIHNHFNLDRHLSRRDIFKKNRSAALAEWRQLVA
jgi:putative transposase